MTDTTNAAPADVTGPSETVKFVDESTADPVEKARRYLKAMGDQRMNSAYFFDDGYPRREISQDALATLAVLEQLSAPQPTQAQSGAVPLTDEQIVGVMHSIPINAAPSYHIAFARAIEQAHGIGETP